MFPTAHWLPTILCLGLIAVPNALLRADDGSGDVTRWYKGNIHTHTRWSDGLEFPEMVADWYKSHGYDFLSLSDHDCLMAGEKWISVDRGECFLPASMVQKCEERFGSDWLVTRERDGLREIRLKTYEDVRTKLEEPGHFLLIQNEEIGSVVGDHTIHINALNLAECIQSKTGQDVADTISSNLATIQDQAKRLNRPILGQVNHPNYAFYDISPEDLAAASTAKFFEVCNGHPGTRNLGDATHPSAERLWDIANTIRLEKMHLPPLYATGTNDAHVYADLSPGHANPGRAWIMVRAEQLTAAAIIEAMDRGDFYASTGVVLRNVAYDAKHKTITVEVQPEAGVRYTIEFIGTLAGVDPTGQLIDDASADNQKRPARKYSPEVGKVFSSTQDTNATYQLSGKELYVRAVVRSDKPTPSVPGRTQEAWCQPVGWECLSENPRKP